MYMKLRPVAAAVLAGVATLTAIVPAAPAQARACTINHYCFTTWYSDASRTVVVGQKFEDCDGTMSMWGGYGPSVTFREYNC